MNNATAQVDDPVFIGDNRTTSETATSEPKATEPDATSLDLRDIPEPDFQSLLAAPPPPPPPPTATKISSNTDSHVTLGSLAFRLFDTIENQIARDPHAATLSVMSARLDVIERAIAGSAGHSDTLVGLGERLDEIDRHIAAPDPHEASLSAINDRLAAVEHRLAAPHPHSGTIKSLVERLDEAEAKGSPRGDLFSDAEEAQLTTVCQALYSDTHGAGVIIVVTTEEMREGGAASGPFREFTTRLYPKLGLDSPEVNQGLLVFVSRKDRRAGIRMGDRWPTWSRKRDVLIIFHQMKLDNPLIWV